MKNTLTAYECDNPACKKVATTLTESRPPYGWCRVKLASETFFDHQKHEPVLEADYYFCCQSCAKRVLEDYVALAYDDRARATAGTHSASGGPKEAPDA